MKTKFLVIALFSFLNLCLYGQENTLDTTSSGIRQYLKFLTEPGDNGQSTLLTGSWQYLYSPTTWGKTFRTGGMHLSLGLNLSRFVSNKIVLGVFVDFKGVKGFTQQRLPHEFVNDFNSSFIPTYSNQSDSAKAYIVKGAINDVSPYSFWGNYFGDIGLMFSPFPKKYGGVIISVKKGYRSYPIVGTYKNPYLNEQERETVLLDFSDIYSFEIKIKPATFSRKGNVNFKDVYIEDFWKFMTIGFYWEQIRLRNASFDDMQFENMVNSSFIDKYGTDNRYGITLGFAFY